MKKKKKKKKERKKKKKTFDIVALLEKRVGNVASNVAVAGNNTHLFGHGDDMDPGVCGKSDEKNFESLLFSFLGRKGEDLGL